MAHLKESQRQLEAVEVEVSEKPVVERMLAPLPDSVRALMAALERAPREHLPNDVVNAMVSVHGSLGSDQRNEEGERPEAGTEDQRAVNALEEARQRAASALEGAGQHERQLEADTKPTLEGAREQRRGRPCQIHPPKTNSWQASTTSKRTTRRDCSPWHNASSEHGNSKEGTRTRARRRCSLVLRSQEAHRTQRAESW